MKQRHCLLVLGFIAFGLLGCVASIEGAPRPSAPHVELALFWDDLALWGDVEPGWRPYTDGHWAWTRLGWTWVSDRPWVWAPFHYGRWTYHSRYGWIWVPDTVWAPAWVAWRTGPGWIGWAPLPPGVRWRFGLGLDLDGIDLGLSIAGHGWSFCEDRHFLDRRIRHRLAPLPRNAHLLRETRDATRYEEIERRQARELRALRSWEDEQRRRLEQEQQRERRRSPAQEDPAELQRRQEEERRALRREVEREKQILGERVERRARAKEEGQERPRQARPRPPV